MNGKYYRPLVRDPVQLLHDNRKRFFSVHVGRPMKRDVDKTPVRNSESFQDLTVGGLQMGHERIDHDIAHQPDLVLRNSFPAKVLIGILGWSQEQISQRIGHDSVDLLRHGPIEAAQARFHMELTSRILELSRQMF